MKRTAILVLTLSAIAAGPPAHASPGGVKVGVLTCNESSGWGLVLESNRRLNCTYTSATSGRVERYRGHIQRIGIDVGYHDGGVMVWAVLAPTEMRRGGLTGEYGGLSAGATVGGGVDANVLIGGSDKSVSLQPLSIEGEAGLNLAAGVADLDLRVQQSAN